MKLLYLTEANLKDRMLIRDMVFNVKFEDKAILIHEPFQNNLKDTRFVNKRISALMSEAMVYNNAFCADQRKFFTQVENEWVTQKALIEKLLPPIQMLILAPIVKIDGKSQLVPALDLLHSLRKAYEVEEIILFAENPLSPMVSKPKLILTEADRDKLLGIYEEERSALELAFQLRPAILASPSNYSMDQSKKA